jgi:hypothetical protein
MLNYLLKSYTTFPGTCTGCFNNIGGMLIIAGVFALVVIQSTLIGCAATVKSSGVTNSQAATDIWHSYEILPSYQYYYAGPDAQPFYIIGIDDRYKLMSKLWKPVDLTPEMLKNWFNYLRPRVGYSPYLYGADITGPKGERIGLWYSVRDWRQTGSATLGENNQVFVTMPTAAGPRQRKRIPTQDEFKF